MDPLGSRGLVRPSRRGRISHRLAGMGPRHARNCDANNGISVRERSSRDHRGAARASRLATTRAQPGHPISHPRQRHLLSHTSHDRTAPPVPRRLHRYASISAIFVLGVNRSRARWRGSKGDCNCTGRRHSDDGRRSRWSEVDHRRALEQARTKTSGPVPTTIPAGTRRTAHGSHTSPSAS